MFIAPQSINSIDSNGVFNASKFRKALFGGIAALILIAPFSLQAQQREPSPRSHARQGGRHGGSANGGQGGHQGGGTYGGQGGLHGGVRRRGHDDFHRPDGFGNNVWSQHRFQHDPYYSPPGWINRHWRPGEFLPSIYWGQQYWLGDWEPFGLFEPPYGCIWIRYGDDAILIDKRTGEVVDTVYGVF